jgi:hypothetical protein
MAYTTTSKARQIDAAATTATTMIGRGTVEGRRPKRRAGRERFYPCCRQRRCRRCEEPTEPGTGPCEWEEFEAVEEETASMTWLRSRGRQRSEAGEERRGCLQTASEN